MGKALTPGIERKTMIITCNVALETQSTVRTKKKRRRKYWSWLLMATTKHIKMHSSHWSKWEVGFVTGSQKAVLAHSAKKAPTPAPTHISTGFILSGRKAICKQNQCGCRVGGSVHRRVMGQVRREKGAEDLPSWRKTAGRCKHEQKQSLLAPCFVQPAATISKRKKRSRAVGLKFSPVWLKANSSSAVILILYQIQ